MIKMYKSTALKNRLIKTMDLDAKNC